MLTPMVACKDDAVVDDDNDQEDVTDDGPVDGPMDDDGAEPITTNIRLFMFGHSLMNHEPPAIPTPSNETSIPHWMHFLAEASEFDFNANGQYGFLPQHRNLPPISQWGFDHVQSIWDSDTQAFDEADFNTILLTAGNFIQWQPANENYFGDDISPLQATVEIFEWCNQQEDDMDLYIYENWPDMDPYLANEFPEVSTEEFAAYNAYTLGEFHDWWIDYQDMVNEELAPLEVKMIPVGPILSLLLTEIDDLAAIPITELYEDGAPHGRATIYFLAGLITHTALYGAPGPASYEIPDTVHENVRENYDDIILFIWEELEDFNYNDGTSRVW